MNSVMRSATNAQVSTTWLPWVLMILMVCPRTSRVALPRRAGIFTSSEAIQRLLLDCQGHIVPWKPPLAARTGFGVSTQPDLGSERAYPGIRRSPRAAIAVTDQAFVTADILRADEAAGKAVSERFR